MSRIGHMVSVANQLPQGRYAYCKAVCGGGQGGRARGRGQLDSSRARRRRVKRTSERGIRGGNMAANGCGAYLGLRTTAPAAEAAAVAHEPLRQHARTAPRRCQCHHSLRDGRLDERCRLRATAVCQPSSCSAPRRPALLLAHAGWSPESRAARGPAGQPGPRPAARRGGHAGAPCTPPSAREPLPTHALAPCRSSGRLQSASASGPR